MHLDSPTTSWRTSSGRRRPYFDDRHDSGVDGFLYCWVNAVHTNQDSIAGGKASIKTRGTQGPAVR